MLKANEAQLQLKQMIWESMQSKIQFKPHQINKYSWKFDYLQYNFVLLPLKQGALMLKRWQTNSNTFALNHHIKPETFSPDFDC